MSKFNDLLKDAMKQEPIDVFDEWENYTKTYKFPVYKLNLGGRVFVWKLPNIKEQHDKKESKHKEMFDKLYAELIADSKNK